MHDTVKVHKSRSHLTSKGLLRLSFADQESQQRTTDVEDDLARAEERLAMASAQLQQTRVRTAADASEAQNGSAPGMLLLYFCALLF